MPEKINLGRIMPIHRGDYSSNTTYEKMDVVKSGGATYWCKQQCTGVTPPNDTYWVKLADKGEDGTNGQDGTDGLDAYQPFKGWYDTSSSLGTAFPTPQVGDYAYVVGATSSDPVTIYKCATAGTWAASSSTFNPANNQEFASGQSLNTVNIVDNLNSSSATDVLSAKQGKALDEKVSALGPKISEVKNKWAVAGTGITSQSNLDLFNKACSSLFVDVSGYTGDTADLSGGIKIEQFYLGYYVSSVGKYYFGARFSLVNNSSKRYDSWLKVDSTDNVASSQHNTFSGIYIDIKWNWNAVKDSYGNIFFGSADYALLNWANATNPNIDPRGSVATDNLKDSSVTSAKIASNAVNSNKIASSSVTTEKVADGAITEQKMAGAVATKINDSARGIAFFNLLKNNFIQKTDDVSLNITNGYYYYFYANDFRESSLWKYAEIQVSAGENYVIKATAGQNCRLWNLLDSSDNLISYSNDASAVIDQEEALTIPNGVVKMIVNCRAEKTLLVRKVVGGTLNPSQMFIGEQTIKEYIDSISPNAFNPLYGKTLVCCGDSITYGADMDAEGITDESPIDVYNCNAAGVFSKTTSGFRKAYGYQIAERNNMVFYNGGISGSTMQGLSDKNGFSLANGRYTKLPDNIDYLTIFFGWNDAAYGTLGTISDITNESYYGGYNVVLPYLIDKYPYTKIVLIVPFGTSTGHRNAIRALANKWGLACFDMYQGGTPLYFGKETSVGVDESIVTSNKAKFQANGAHPNFKGHKQIADMLEHFLRGV